ncbi:MAG TPA: NUDIX hydrolase [Actinomycetota bacterium]|nr:NUDIX hydrolase [Actinomycetota bacterium]
MSPVLGVGAVVVHAGALLMVRRASNPARGLWSIPGGRVEKGEYLSAALKREVGEETGLDVEPGDLIGIFEIVGEDDHFVILDYRATVTERGEPTPGGDVSEARWVPFDEVPRLECTPRLIETLTAWSVLTSEASTEE